MEEINTYETLVGRPEGKKPFGRSRRLWEDNITMDLWEIVREGVRLASSGSGWEPVAGSCEHEFD
jgi:hypothetical protein